MRIGFLSTRLAGLDGVSLETAKWAEMFRRMGHRVFYLAGELDPEGPPGMEVPLFHFRHPRVQALQRRFFSRQPQDREWLRREIDGMARELEGHLEAFVERFGIQVLVLQNVLAIPMHVPLGVAVTRFLRRTGLPAVAHHHDFFWERARFAHAQLPQLLQAHFPPVLPNLLHVVINTPAREALRARKGVESVVVPNVMDFHSPPPPHNGLALRAYLGLSPEDLLVVQPTRVVPRKGIEWALELVHHLARPRWRRRLGAKRPVLVVTHPAGDEGVAYLHALQAKARRLKVPFLYIAPLVGERARPRAGIRFSLNDVYAQADAMTYPSKYEGFGNALLEGVYWRLPMLVNRYPVYERDIRPHGFRFVEMDQAVTPDVVEAFVEQVMDPGLRREVVDHNFWVASRVFSFENVMPVLEGVLERAAGGR